MAKPRPWTEASHGPLTALADGLWTVEATLETLPIGRRMVVFRLDDGSLAVHSAVCCDAATMAAIDAEGPVRWIIVPSGYHRLDAGAWKARYPEARVITRAASRARVEQRVAVDGDYDLLPAGGPLSWVALDGVPAEGAFVHRDPAGAVTLVFNDAFMNIPDRLPGFRGLVVKLIGSAGGPKVTRTAKYFIVKDRPAYAAHLRRLAETPGLARVIPGHGLVVASDPGAALVRAGDGLHRA
jgi:hypothetical protein